MRSFRGARALITGGSSGIGLATALALARSGAHVAILARGEDRLRAAHARLQAEASQAVQRLVWIAGDVSQEADAERMVREGIAALDGLDLLVNNAGVARAGRILETPPADYRRMMDINYQGVVNMTRAALPHLLAHRSGHVCNVSSLAGLLAIYGYTAYAPSKYAVTGFSEALRQELRPHGIGVSVLFPPDTDTPQLAEEELTRPEETRAVSGNVPVLSAETVAESLLAGISRGRFWIVPGRRARLVAFAMRHVPGVVRWLIDRDLARLAR